jgi:hypothetical protein
MKQTRRAEEEFVAEEDGESFDVEDVKVKDGLEYSSPVPVPLAKPVAPTPSRPKPAADLTHRFYMGVCKRCQKTYEAWKAADRILPCIPGGTPLESSCNCERNQINCTYCFPETDKDELGAIS